MKRGWGMRLKASVLFSAIAVLLGVACTESPTNSDPPDPEPERTPSLRLIAPVAGQRVISGDTMDIAWEIVLSKTETRAVVKDSGSAEIQYTVLGGQPEWRMVNVVPASLQQYRWKVPANLQQDFAGNYPITIHRQRGLTNARYYTGRYPNASEHVFRLLP